MRTTIEITDDQRARLVEIAASRGDKGFSAVVREAIDLFLEKEGHRAGKIQAALALQGVLGRKEGEALAQATRDLRTKWR